MANPFVVAFISGTRASILLVEADRAVCLTLKQILEQSGYRVAAASTLAEGLGFLGGGRVKLDAVITELNVGGSGSGLELARAAKRLALPPVVVIYTGYPDKEQLRKAMSLRVDYLALKPVEVREITSALSTLIARRAVNAALALS
jgi:CheY-like chemotaxis protein